MKKFLLVGSTLAFLVSAPGTANPATVAHLTAFPKHPRTCARTFTLASAKRAARQVYGGVHRVTRVQRRMLSGMQDCQLRPWNRAKVRKYIAAQRKAWKQRRWDKAHPMYWTLCSWYQDGGSTASGFHAHYGIANKVLPFGTKVVFRYHGHEVTAIVDDRGPFSGQRVYDLNQNVASALGFSGVDQVQASNPGT